MIDKLLKFSFALVAASIAAGMSYSLALVVGASLHGAPVLNLWHLTDWLVGLTVLPFIGLTTIPEAFILLALFVFGPLQIVLAWRGKNGRVAHIAASTFILLVVVLGSLLILQYADTRPPPPLLDELMLLAPVAPLLLPPVLFAALVSGSTFTCVMNAPQKLELWLVAPLLIWCVALYVAAQDHVTAGMSGTHWSYHPEFARDPIRVAWSRYGSPLLILLGGVGAFLACLHPRLSLAFFATALAMPLSFGLWYRLTPTGPVNPSFTLGNRTFSLDWRLEPRLDKDQFSFVAEKSGPWRIANSPFSSNMSITIGTDLAKFDSLNGYSWERGPYEKEGLSCRDGRFERRPENLAVVCEAKTADGHVLSYVMCEAGYCSHHFRSGEFAYWLHYNRDDFPKWRAFETETVAYIDRAARGELRDVLKGRKCSITYRCAEDAWLDNQGTANNLPRPAP